MRSARRTFSATQAKDGLTGCYNLAVRQVARALGIADHLRHWRCRVTYRSDRLFRKSSVYRHLVLVVMLSSELILFLLYTGVSEIGGRSRGGPQQKSILRWVLARFSFNSHTTQGRKKKPDESSEVLFRDRP